MVKLNSEHDTATLLRPSKVMAETRQEGASLLAALAYADLFDYPLTEEELATFQVGTRLSRYEVAEQLRHEREAGRSISSVDGYHCLRRREATIAIRRRRAKASEHLWHRAHVYGRLIARLPFVRMVAVTGSLAVSNVSTRTDIDLLVVAEPGRVWICRRWIVAFVRFARLLGDDLCPNYIISGDNLALQQQDLFTAHELVHMVPLHGFVSYWDMLLANSWAQAFLPEAYSGLVSSVRSSRKIPSSEVPSRLESIMKDRRFDPWERWEMRRLQARLGPLVGGDEVVCSPNQCKGHTTLHRQSIISRYEAKLARLGLTEQVRSLFLQNSFPG